MAIIWYEHFDLYGGVRNELLTRGYDAFANANSILSTTARNGSHAFELAGNSTNQSIRRSLPVTATVAGVGAAIQRLTNGETANSSIGVRLEASGVTYAAVVNANNGISIYSGSTLLASSANSIVPADTYVWLELKCDSVGDVVSARVNGQNEISASTPVNPLTHFMVGKSSGAARARFDDVVVWDNTDTVNNDWSGDTFVIAAPPTADGVLDQFVPSSGSDAWAMVDETTPNDTDFVTANTVGHIQEFAHAALNLPVGAVAAIAAQTRALKTDAGASSIEVGLLSNGAASMSAENALSVGATSQTHISNRNPDGNVPWTQSAAQAARLRIRRAA